MRRRWAVLPALMVLIVLLAFASGCEHRSEAAPAADAPAATLTATAGYGATRLLSARVAPDQSVMRALRGATEVTTAYAGAFVNGMLGHQSDHGGPADWFLFVNGIASPVGAKAVTVHDGDTIWWDYRAWPLLISTPALVGAWPAPLVLPGDRSPAVAADAPLAAALEADGARITAGQSPWRARVGASDALAARDPAWRRALADPDGAGLTATISDGRIVALDARGRSREPVPGARALVAAVPSGTDATAGVLFVVAGLDAASARAAADAIVAHPEILRERYALTFDGAGHPLRAGGRTGP